MNIFANAVTLSIGNTTILRNITASISDKEFLGIIGPNGSGKSTFLKCLYRTMNPSAGAITLNDKQLDELSYRETALYMAVVAQHSHVNFDITVADMVLMGRSPYKGLLDRNTKTDFDMVYTALQQVGLGGFESRNFNTLSGGEQQRVILARALVQDTECLILDEPTNHLDIKYQLELLNTIKHLDKTVVAALHDLNLAALYCDRLIIIQDGEVVLMGTPKEVLTPDNIYRVFGVKAEVYNLSNDRLTIVYMDANL